MSSSSSLPAAGYLSVLRRRWPWVATILPVAVLGSVFLAFVLPAKYRSTAVLTYESAAFQKDLIQTSVASYADEQIEIISGKVMTLDTLKSVVSQFDPYPERPDLDATQKAQLILQDMQIERVDPISGLPLDKSSAFAVHYDNADPKRAAAVTSRLADLFVTYHQRVRSETANAATAMIEAQADSITKDLAKLDGDYAELRNRYGQAMPDEEKHNQDQLDRAERDLDSVNRDLRTAQEKESLLTIQLSGLSPNLLANKGDLTDLATVKAQLADAEQRYTPDHPDVKRLRRAMATLMSQGNAGGLSAASHADNPDYRRVASQLDSAHKEVTALQANASRTRAQIDQYSGFLRRSPDIEREYTALQRRRESLQNQYLQVQEKLKNAKQGQVFEAGTQGEHFTMIRSPSASRQPATPNRVGIVLLGLVLGAALLAACIAITESTDATVRGSRDLEGFDFAPVLGGVPKIASPSDLRQRRLVVGWVSAAYIVFFVIVAGTVYLSEVQMRRTAATVTVE